MIRVLLVDRQPEVRMGLRMRLAIEPDITVVGDTGTVEQALSLAQALAPDVAVLDIDVYSAEGVTLVRRLQTVAPSTAVIILTLRGGADARARALAAGALAYLEKCRGAPDLLEAIRHAALPMRLGAGSEPAPAALLARPDTTAGGAAAVPTEDPPGGSSSPQAGVSQQ